MSYTQRTPWEGARISLLGANVGVALPGNMVVSAYASKQLNAGKSFAGGLNLIIPFDDRRMTAASSARDASGHAANTVPATQSVPAGPGWGWRVAGSDSDAQRVQAGTTYNGNNAQFIAQVNAGQDANAVRLGANGSVGWMSGLAFALRRIDQGAFAVVRVGDLGGVQESLSNQVVAVTNSKGLALVTGLLPHQVSRSDDRATRLSCCSSRMVRRFPAGARGTTTPGHHEFIVARRGEVYLLDLSDENRIEVRWKGGGCTLLLKMPPVVPGSEPPRIGPRVCGAAQ